VKYNDTKTMTALLQTQNTTTHAV